MNAAPVIVALAVLGCLAASILHTRRAARGQSHPLPRAGRFVHRRQRHAASLQARQLARAINDHHPDPTAHLAAGVILQPGEEAWMRTPARLAVRASQTSWTAHTQLSWLGRRARNVSHETTTEQWHDRGEIDWLITTQRIVGRQPATSDMISLWWSALAGVDIDLKHDSILLNGMNGWTGILTGPTVAPIAVAAVALCHGLEALQTHPALEKLRQQPPPIQEPEDAGSGGTIVQLPTRTQTA